MTAGTLDFIARTAAADLINKVCDEVLEHTTNSEELVDLMNLVVNVFVSRMSSPEESLDEIIRDCYETEPHEVLGWLP